MSASRNLTIDIARGFIILLVPAIHVTLMYSTNSVKVGLLGFVLRCFAEGPGAQLFMFLMGFCIVLARKKSPNIILRRSISLLCVGYLLNFLKFILPSLIGLLPIELFTAYGLSNDIFGYIDLFFIGDILQFAAISYLLCGFLFLWKYGFYATGILSVVIIILSPFLWDQMTHVVFIDLFIKLFNGFPPRVFFPFFPWAAYPLFGLFFGFIFLKMESSKFYHLLLKAGLVFCLVGLIISAFEPRFYNLSFYRLGPGGTIFHLGIVFVWIRICHAIACKKSKTIFVKLLCFLSQRIMVFYIIQWLLICWLLFYFGFNENGLFDTCLEIIFITLLTFFITLLLEYISKKLVLLRKGSS